MKTPRTPAQWQEAMNIAQSALYLHSARIYGLVTGGPVVNVDRCEALLAKGRALGYAPRAETLDSYIRILAGYL